MKISKYTFLFDCKNSEFYIYNTLSNALVELDKSSYEYLSNLKDSKEISQKELDPELYKVLVTKKFITENDQDDFLLYKSVITLQRSSKSMMHLTIAPTMDCCFKCNYCFEKYKKPTPSTILYAQNANLFPFVTADVRSSASRINSRGGA